MTNFSTHNPKVIDGKTIAEELRRTIADDVRFIKDASGEQPRLDVILVGDNPASHIYVERKQQACAEVGIATKIHHFDANITQRDLEVFIYNLQNDPSINGVLVQLPLPQHLDTNAILNLIDPVKDVDGLTTLNQGKLLHHEIGVVPCTPQGCLQLIKSVCPTLSGKVAVVIGRSILVGKPVAQLLLKEDCTVIQCHSKTVNLDHFTRQADIIVAAIGKPNFITSSMIKDGAIIIDVGINRDANNQLSGDVDFNDCIEKASYITPVPGGVGPMTVANLLLNTIVCYRLQRK